MDRTPASKAGNVGSNPALTSAEKWCMNERY